MALEQITQDRIEILKKEIVSSMEKRLAENIERISQYVYEHDDAEIAYFSSIIEDLYEKAIEAQKCGHLDKIRYIYVSYLRTGALNGKLELQIRVMDKETYNDCNSIDVAWVPTFANDYFKADIEYMLPCLRNRIFRLTAREERIATLMYASDYYKIVLEYLFVFIDAFQYNSLFDELETEDKISILFGEMCEAGTEIYSFRSKEE